MKLRIGTRGSKLALIQAEEVKRRVTNICQELVQVEIIPIKTSGDVLLHSNLYEIGGKGLFIKEIEEALLAGSIDLAVHSLKDMPAFLPEGLAITAVLEREDPRDVLISRNKASTIMNLPTGSLIGTSSPRRKAQLLHIRPDFQVINFRGNVDTRINKLDKGEADATVLAAAGLKRLGIMGDERCLVIDTDVMLPAVAQGAIGIESKVDNEKLNTILELINHKISSICVNAERAFLQEFGASCNTPIAALAELSGDQICLRAFIASPDGISVRTTKRIGNISDALLLGQDAAKELLSNSPL